LLEETGQSFTERLVERRLERAFAMLTDPRCLHLAIVDIALAAGFGDVSHFNRMFRRRFGDMPSGARAGGVIEREGNYDLSDSEGKSQSAHPRLQELSASNGAYLTPDVHSQRSF
jgi:AraC-like DNA-binding protein